MKKKEGRMRNLISRAARERFFILHSSVRLD